MTGEEKIDSSIPPAPTRCYTLSCTDCGCVVSCITDGGTVTMAKCWRCGKKMAVCREITVRWFEDGRSIQFTGGDM
jgi:hypothetical protein